MEIKRRKKVGSAIARLPLLLADECAADAFEVRGRRKGCAYRARFGAEPDDVEALSVVGGEQQARAVLTAGMRLRRPACTEHDAAPVAVQPPAAAVRRLAPGQAEVELGAGPPPKDLLAWTWLPAIAPKEYRVAAGVCQSLAEGAAVAVRVHPDVRWDWNVSLKLAGVGKREAAPSWEVAGTAVAAFDGERRDAAPALAARPEEHAPALLAFRELLGKVLPGLRHQWTRALDVLEPSLRVRYRAQFEERDEGPGVDSAWEVALEAEPLLKLSYHADLTEPLLREASAKDKPLAALLAALKALPAGSEASVEVFASGEPRGKAAAAGVNGKAARSDGAIAMRIPFRVEGKARAPGSAVVVKFAAAAPFDGRVGFGGKVEIGADEEGITLSRAFHFSGVRVMDIRCEEPAVVLKRNKGGTGGGVTWLPPCPGDPGEAKNPVHLLQ